MALWRVVGNWAWAASRPLYLRRLAHHAMDPKALTGSVSWRRRQPLQLELHGRDLGQLAATVDAVSVQLMEAVNEHVQKVLVVTDIHVKRVARGAEVGRAIRLSVPSCATRKRPIEPLPALVV